MDKFFEISKRGSTVKTEIFAGLTTFFAMAYIIIVNPNQVTGFSEGMGQIWNAVYVGSILVAVIGTLIMGLYAKMPFAQACGMGLNSFFFVSFILPELMSGGDPVEGYHAGLVIVFISGLVFLVLSVTGARQYIAKAMPQALKVSVSAGIGLFIAYIGFQNVGFIEDNPYTLTQLVDVHGAIENGELLGAVPAILAFAGFLLIVILGKRGVRGNVIIGMFVTAIFYYIIVREAPHFDSSQVGQSFRDFIDVGIFGVFSGDAWHAAFSPELVGGVLGGIMLVVAFCLVDMFDTVGTLYGTAAGANMLDENGDPINLDKCMMADSTATVVGGMLGTSTCTTFVESATGVSAGGRTGLTSVTTAVCFFLCLFLTPLAAVVPACATSPALIYVGVLMLGNVKKIDMTDLTSSAVGFMTIITMLLSYSIANGIGVGAITYTAITIFTGKYSSKDVMVTVIALLFILKFCTITM